MQILNKNEMHLKAHNTSHKQRELPCPGAHPLRKLFKKMSIMRSSTSWTHERSPTNDDEDGRWSTWSSGKDMGTSTIVGNPPQISINVPRCLRSTIRGTWVVGESSEHSKYNGVT